MLFVWIRAGYAKFGDGSRTKTGLKWLRKLWLFESSSLIQHIQPRSLSQFSNSTYCRACAEFPLQLLLEELVNVLPIHGGHSSYKAINKIWMENWVPICSNDDKCDLTGAARCSKVQHGLQETEGQVFRIALAPRLSKLLPVIPRTSGNFVPTCPAKQLLSKRAM